MRVFMSACTCLWYLGVCMHIQMIGVFSTSAYCLSRGQISRCQGIETMDLPFCLAVIQYVLLCHSLKESYSPTNFLFSPCVSAGTLSVCVNEKFVDPPLHTMALQFLCTIFKEETKSLGVEVTTSNSKHATALSDIVNGPSANQLCELLLQVCGDGGGGHVVVGLDLGTQWDLELAYLITSYTQ